MVFNLTGYQLSNLILHFKFQSHHDSDNLIIFRKILIKLTIKYCFDQLKILKSSILIY